MNGSDFKNIHIGKGITVENPNNFEKYTQRRENEVLINLKSKQNHFKGYLILKKRSLRRAEETN